MELYIKTRVLYLYFGKHNFVLFYNFINLPQIVNNLKLCALNVTHLTENIIIIKHNFNEIKAY